MSGLTGKKISAKEIAADIRRGLDDIRLQRKYGLSDQDLVSVYKKLVDADMLTETEIANRSADKLGKLPVKTNNVPDGRWRCPACDAPQPSEKQECPVCGIIVAKLLARQQRKHARKADELSEVPAPCDESKRANRMPFLLTLLVCVAGIAAWQFLGSPNLLSEFRAPPSKVKSKKRSHANRLAINDKAILEETVIPLQPMMDLDFKTKAELYQLRSDAALRYSQLIVGDYQPSHYVFGRIVDGAPWWGVQGYYLHGKGERSIEGPSFHSLSILNPYLLVAVFPYLRRWDQDYFESVDPLTGYPRYICTPQRLRWYPKKGRAVITYDADCMQHCGADVFGLDAYNASDFGLRYIYISYRNSINISKDDKPSGVYKNPQYIHRGGSCGYQGGCNNRSPATPPLSYIRISDWPAMADIHLWENRPANPEDPSDMELIIKFE